jgi:isopenicillin-N N-acyltransferase-like protein
MLKMAKLTANQSTKPQAMCPMKIKSMAKSGKASTALLLTFLLLATASSPTHAAERLFAEAKHGDGQLQYIGELPVATLAGTPQELGEQQAALLAKPAGPLLKYPQKIFAAVGMKNAWPMAVVVSNRLLAQAPQRYRDEMAAVVKHAELDDNDIHVANTLLELRRMGCSTLIVEPARSATGGPIFGRNFDFPSFDLLDRFGVVMVVRPKDKHAFVSVGYPGLMGVVSGMNDAGLTLATLDVYRTADKSPRFDRTGVPLMFVFRQILEECSTVEEAEKLLKNTKATTRANLAVCDRNRGMVFEITPRSIATRKASDGLLPCTNHFRTEGLCVSKDCWRYDNLLIANQDRQLDVATVKRRLHDARQGKLTLQTMIFEPRDLTLHLSLGPPPASAQPLQKLELRDLLGKDED